MPRAKLSNVSLKQLVAELARRRAKLASLIAQRDDLNKQIGELEAFPGSEPEAGAQVTRRGKPGRKPGRKPGSKVQSASAAARPLAEYVREVLAKAATGLKVREIEAKVLAAGYPTKAATIYNPVMKVLSAGFKKVTRGVYALKKGIAAAGKAVAAKAVAAPRKTGRTRGQFAMTAEQFVTDLLSTGGPTTSTAINAEWKKSGRAGDANVTLSKMTKAKKLKRVKLKEGRGSTYTVA